MDLQILSYRKGDQTMIETKTILNKDNDQIFIELYIPENIRSTIVFCHGITGCRKGRVSEDSYLQILASKLSELGYKVVLFDFSGHGDSQGNDYDVCLSKSTDELTRVFNQEVSDSKNVSFLAFSYGAAVLDNFLAQNKDVIPTKMVFFSPCIFPLESCFLNPKSVFGKDIVKAYNEGTLQSNGYTIVGAKNFRFGYNMILECQQYKVSALQQYKDRMIIMTGTQDVILDTQYNEDFCKENFITTKHYVASHSLFEDIDNVAADVISFFES